jgi:rhamnulokinase
MSYLAIDLGAGSGRAIVGTIVSGRLELREVWRFANEPVVTDGVLRWNFDALMENIRHGISLAGDGLRGVGVDTWGVDFGLLDAKGALISPPVCYRDGRTQGMLTAADRLVSRDEMYATTGIQQMEINTLYQLMATPADELARAHRLLFTPDLINYMLTGVAANEYTIASTSQLLDARSRGWATDIIERLAIPHRLFGAIVAPGAVVGTLPNGVRVFAVGSHDTASAIAAIPAEGDDWAFLSSGTWSLMGVTLDEPVLTPRAHSGQFTNEGGVAGKTLFMRNITGLWLLQRLMAEWGVSDYGELLAECAACESFRSLVDGDDPAFVNPASMSAAIGDYCERTGQPVPRTRGEMVRCVLESLALKYRAVAAGLTENTARPLRRLFIVGGGSKNRLLNQWVADALGVEVITGLAEGTAVGNIITQAIADGAVRDRSRAHEIIRASFPPERYTPGDGSPWVAAAKKIENLQLLS